MCSYRNQFSPIPQASLETESTNAERVKAIRIWQVTGGMSGPDIGRKMNPPISGTAVLKLLKAKRISFERHADFIAAGVPEYLLPPPQVVPVGRPPSRQNSENHAV